MNTPTPVTAKSLRPAPSAEADTRPDRKSDILLAAEMLFAQRGYHAVTIRQIAQEAGVPLALVGYYYGQKHELFHAIFEHWNTTILERLDALARVRDAALEPDYLDRVIEAFADPVLRLRASPEGEWYALLITRGLNEPGDQADRAMASYFDPLAHAFIDALMAAFPGTSRSRVAWAYQFMLGALLHHISDTRVERLSNGVNRPCDPQAAPMLRNFMLGGIRAVLGDNTAKP